MAKKRVAKKRVAKKENKWDEIFDDIHAEGTTDENVPEEQVETEEILEEVPTDDDIETDIEDTGKQESEPQAEEAAEKEEEDWAPKVPDHPDVITALKDLQARVDIDEHGRVFRVIFYRNANDDYLVHIPRLPALRELWTIGTKVTDEAVDELKKSCPRVQFFHKPL
ncbi:MAG: hypothetical protein MPJ24_04065 [Pirellulaceae bacterium]|nr:hypothetical protein [Pirellulaceae bacterium]